MITGSSGRRGRTCGDRPSIRDFRTSIITGGHTASRPPVEQTGAVRSWSGRAGRGERVLEQRDDGVRPVTDVVERLLVANPDEALEESVDVLLREPRRHRSRSARAPAIRLGLARESEADELLTTA